MFQSLTVNQKFGDCCPKFPNPCASSTPQDGQPLTDTPSRPFPRPGPPLRGQPWDDSASAAPTLRVATALATGLSKQNVGHRMP